VQDPLSSFLPRLVSALCPAREMTGIMRLQQVPNAVARRVRSCTMGPTRGCGSPCQYYLRVKISFITPKVVVTRPIRAKTGWPRRLRSLQSTQVLIVQWYRYRTVIAFHIATTRYLQSPETDRNRWSHTW
jgi:hypothetical protein